jgi:hypothetical protein
MAGRMKDVPKLRHSDLLGPLKPALLLGFAWWAVQGSNL